MACPQCNGLHTAPIAPGYVECRSTVRTWVPNPKHSGHGALPGEPEFLPIDRTCGHRYQTGMPAEGAAMCRCSTFAIGVCHTCRVPVCGDHSGVIDETRLCGSHSSELQSLRSAESAAELERSEADRQQRLLAKHEAEAKKLVEARTLVNDFLARMAEASNPGAQSIWEHDGVHYSHTRKRAKPAWQGWHHSSQSWQGWDRDDRVTCSEWLVLTTSGNWLSAPNHEPQGRMSGSSISERHGTIWGMHWSVNLLDAVQLLPQLASTHGVQLRRQ